MLSHITLYQVTLVNKVNMVIKIILSHLKSFQVTLSHLESIKVILSYLCPACDLKVLALFVTHVCPIFALNYVSEDDYDNSSDKKFGYVFAVHTVCLLTITICCI